MKFFKLIFAVALIMVMAIAPAQAQTWQTIGMDSYVTDYADSTAAADFAHVYYYILPDGMRPDSLQLVYYQKSTAGTPVIGISYAYGMYYGGKRSDSKISAGVTTIDASYEVELNSSWSLTLAAGDTTASGEETAYNILKVMIDGVAANETDTDYAFIVRGITKYENTRYKQPARKLFY